MTASRFRHIVYGLALLGGCVSPSRYERVDVTLERIQMRDEWLATAVPFGLVVLLLLLLAVLYYRRRAPNALDVLFAPRRAPDVIGTVRAWFRSREELAPFDWLLRLEKHRLRKAQGAAEREAERSAELEAQRAAREEIRLAEEARRALPPLGPSRLGFFSRFGIGFATGLILTAAFALPLAAADQKNGALIAVIVGVVGILISLVVSLVCAILATTVGEKTIGYAMIWGALGAAVVIIALPILWLAKPVIVVVGGIAIGFSIGTADQMSRQRETA